MKCKIKPRKYCLTLNKLELIIIRNTLEHLIDVKYEGCELPLTKPFYDKLCEILKE